MKDFPLFTTEYGAASLVLREIPYQQTAYITVLDSREPEALVGECVSFCRVCGAERVYGRGHPWLERFPLYTILWEMECPKASLTAIGPALEAVDRDDLDLWRRLYNEKVVHVPNGAWMTEKEAFAMAEQGGGWFLRDRGRLLGIGRTEGDRIQWVSAHVPGAGETLVRALAGTIPGETVRLTVASTNTKAMGLYERLGFVKTREITRWYGILHKSE